MAYVEKRRRRDDGAHFLPEEKEGMMERASDQVNKKRYGGGRPVVACGPWLSTEHVFVDLTGTLSLCVCLSPAAIIVNVNLP